MFNLWTFGDVSNSAVNLDHVFEVDLFFMFLFWKLNVFL